MSEAITATYIAPMAVGDVRHAKVSFVDALDTSETLSGTPLVTEVTTTDLTLTNKKVNTEILTLKDGTSVAVGKGVQFTIAGQLKANSPYTIKVKVTTSSGQTFTRYVIIEVER